MSGAVTCIITKSLCMENGEGCINVQDTFLIPKGKTIKDKGSKVYMTWKYQYKHSANTSATIVFEGCGTNRDIKYDYNKMMVEV